MRSLLTVAVLALVLTGAGAVRPAAADPITGEWDLSLACVDAMHA